MQRNYTAKYTRISSGYMWQLVEWPEVVTEGKDIEECREMHCRKWYLLISSRAIHSQGKGVIHKNKINRLASFSSAFVIVIHSF